MRGGSLVVGRRQGCASRTAFGGFGLDPVHPPGFWFCRRSTRGAERALRARSWLNWSRLYRRIPGLLAGDHCDQDVHEFAQAGDEGDLLELAVGDEAIVVGLEDGVVLGGGTEHGHVEDAAQLLASAGDAAGAGVLAAVVVVGGDADEGGDLGAGG